MFSHSPQVLLASIVGTSMCIDGRKTLASISIQPHFDLVLIPMNDLFCVIMNLRAAWEIGRSFSLKYYVLTTSIFLYESEHDLPSRMNNLSG